MRTKRTLKRLLSIMLCVVMAMSLLPTSAWAAAAEPVAGPSPGEVSPMAVGDDYTVSFVKDAFNITSIGVVLIDGSSTPVHLVDYLTTEAADSITLDGASFNIGEDTIPITNLVSGYGLTTLDTTRGTGGNSQYYYFQFASWEESNTAVPVNELTYEDVEEHAGETLYLQYRAVGTNLTFTVNAVDDNDTPLTTSSNFQPGAITEERAQEVLREGNVSRSYFFERAELRRIDGSGNPIPVDYIDCMGGYYYVRSSISTNDEDAFSADDYAVYFVYTLAYTLTLSVTDDNDNQNNLINGQHLSAGTHTYQIPQNGVLEINVQMAPLSNLTVTNTTGGSSTQLFSSSVDGYQIKTYTIRLDGESITQDQTVSVVFTSLGTSQYILDYGHYVDYPGVSQSYHGQTVQLNGVNLDRGQRTTTIQANDVLRFNTNDTYMVNTIVLNNVALPLPAGWTWEKPAGTFYWSNTVRDFAIRDSLGQEMAVVDITTVINYSRISIAYGWTEVTFKSINQNIRLDRANLAPETYPDLIIYEIGDGLSGTIYNNNTSPLIPGATIYNLQATGANPSLDLSVSFGHYVTQFQMNEDSFIAPSAASNTNWWGDKDYYANSDGGPLAQENFNKIQNAGSSRGYLESSLINFTFRYNQDGIQDGRYFTDDEMFYLGTDYPYTLAIASDMEPDAPPNQIFVGWSLYPASASDRGTTYISGQVIPRTIIEASQDTVVDYGEVGRATITLYPVFESVATSPYANYTVMIHAGSDTRLVSGIGVIGSSLDRDLVLAMEDVASYVATLGGNYALDGAKSNGFMEITRDGNNQFHLYYNTTQPVSITFVSPYGFDDSTTPGNTDTKVINQTPGAVMNVPTPYEGPSVPATFVGWSIVDSATTGTSLENALVPYEATTYYAIYAPDYAVSFYAWTEASGWSNSADLTISVGNGTSIPNGERSNIESLQSNITGYTFTGWALNGPSGQVIDLNGLMAETFTTDANYYAIYAPVNNITVTLNANGGTFGSSATQELSNQTYGQTISYTEPTREGYVFAGWSTNQNDAIGEMNPTVPAISATYYAVWIRPSLEVTVAAGTYTYNGQAQTPTLTVRYNDEVVSTGYTAAWNNNTNAGTASVSVEYNGHTGFATFTIHPKPINDGTVNVSSLSSQEYTGSEIRPAVTITDSSLSGGGTLQLNRDYVVNYSNNTDVGTNATVTIQGIGNYANSRTQVFEIVAPNSITIAPIPPQEHTGSDIEPDLVVTDSNGRLLVKDTDYTATYRDNTNVGTASVTITGRNNYNGLTASGTFQITAAGSALTVTVNPVTSAVGAGTPSVAVTSGGSTLTGSTHYNLTYQMYDGSGGLTSATSTMEEAGIYLITATGIGSYSGATGTATFVRTPVNTSGNLSITGVTNTVLTYDGTNQNSVLNGLGVEYSGTPLNTADYNLTITYNNTTTWNSVSTADLTDAGTYLVTVEATGSYSGTATLTIYIQPKDISDNSVQVTGDLTQVYDGSAKNPNLTVTDTAIGGGGETLTSSVDYTVSGSGTQTNAGSYPITISGTGNYVGTRVESFAITPKEINVTGSISLEYGYTTTEAQDALRSLVTNAQNDVVAGDNATVSLSVDANLPVAASQSDRVHGSITGTDANNYTLTVNVTVTVTEADIGGGGTGGGTPGVGFGVAVYPASSPFTGSFHSPNVVVTHNNVMLSAGTDYTLTYTDSSSNDVGANGMIQVGTYTITVTGTGNYTGTATVTYTITSASTSGGSGGLTIAPITAQTYTGSDIEPAVTVSFNSTPLVATRDYTVRYSSNINAGTATVTVEGVTGTSYAGMTGTATFTINPKDINDGTVSVDNISAQEYTGSEIRPIVSVTDGGITPTAQLVLNEHYVVSYRDNINVGTNATVTIQGIGNYTGTRTETFEIVPPSNIYIAAIPPQEHTGGAIEPDLVVYDNNNRLLLETTDYTVTYRDNTNVGTASVTVTGQGNYDGLTASGTFQITAAGSALTVTVNPVTSAVGTGTPSVTVTSGGSTLTASTHYNLTYQMYDGSGGLTSATSTMEEAGIYLITATGIGSYSGATGTATFVRTPVNTSGNLSITGVTNTVLTYNGTNQNAVLSGLGVEYSGTPLTPSDYNLTITYNNDPATSWTDINSADLTNAGTYLISVEATGSYSGSTSLTIYIQPKNIADGTVEVTSLLTSEYDGRTKLPTISLFDRGAGTGTALDPSTDYSVSSIGSYTDAGSYPITISGTGNYSGTHVVNYTIMPKQIDVAGSIELEYGYTTADSIAALATLLANAQSEIETRDAATVGLSVEPNMSLGSHTDRVRGSITGTGANNYSLNVTTTVEVVRANIGPGGGGGTGSSLVVNVYPPSASFTGSAHNPTVVVTYNGVVLNNGTDYQLTYQNSSGTDVGLNGMIQMGTYTILVTGINNYTGSAQATYTITNAATGSAGVLTIAAIPAETYTGSPIQPTISVSFNTLSLRQGTDYTVSYSSNTNVGLGVVTVTGQGTYAGMTGTATFAINPKPIDDSSITVTGISSSYDYTGSPIQPAVTVLDGGKTLVAGTDYYVTYSENLNAGTATVTISGINNYGGTRRQNFTINAASIGPGPGGGGGTPSAGFSVAVYPPTAPFTGYAHTPAVVVTYNGVMLDSTRDYTLTYRNSSNTNVGATGMVDVDTYTITVTGMNNYTGSAQATYTITPVSGGGGTGGGSTLVIDPIPAQIYTGSPITPTIDVTFNGLSVNSTDYTVTYSANINVGQATVIVEGNPGTNYANMVGTATFTINPKDITGTDIAVGAIPNQTYTGSAIEPEPTVTDNTRSTNLILGADYILGYAGNVNVGTGTATVTITGRGNYTGTREVYFNITHANIGGGDGDPTTPGTGFTVNVYPATGVHTGSAHHPSVVVHYNNQLLTENLDYTLSYADSDNTDVGPNGMIDVDTYTITVTGQGNYIGTLTATYEIVLNDSDRVLVIAPIDNVEYTGRPATPNIVVSYGSTPLTEGTDYTISYLPNNPINAGGVVVTVTGLGVGYADLSSSAAFQITRKNINSSNITVSNIPDQSYTGGYLTPHITLVDYDREVQLSLNQDYTVEYTNNLAVGTATAIIRGIGNYNGEREVTFQITSADPGTSSIAVNVFPNSGVYTGAPHSPAVIVTHSGVTLVAGRDYTLSYADSQGPINANEMIDIGTYVITATGIGNYTGIAQATYTITATGGTDVTVSFDLNGGTGTGDYSDRTVPVGTTIPLPTAPTREGYTFAGWNDGIATITSGSYTANRNVTLTAQWTTGGGGGVTPPPGSGLVVTVGASAGGSTNPTGSVAVQPGDSLTITITPDEGYVIDNVLVNGVSQGAVSSVTLENIQTNMSVQVNFREEDGSEDGELADPDDTGVSDWLNTVEHIAYLQGYGTEFAPNANMTRGEVAQMFYNLLLEQNVSITTSFSDVPADAWYATAVDTLASLEIIQGYGEGIFAPNATITRAEFTAIAMRFTNSQAPAVENIFTDVDSGDWYYEAVIGATSYGWIQGYGELFAPDATITRAEVTAITNRMLGRVADRTWIDANRDNLTVRFADNDPNNWAYYDIVEATNAHDFTHTDGEEVWTGVN